MVYGWNEGTRWCSLAGVSIGSGYNEDVLHSGAAKRRIQARLLTSRKHIPLVGHHFKTAQQSVKCARIFHPSVLAHISHACVAARDVVSSDVEAERAWRPEGCDSDGCLGTL